MELCPVCGETRFDDWTDCPACGHPYPERDDVFDDDFDDDFDEEEDD